VHDLDSLVAAHPHLVDIVAAYRAWADPEARSIDTVVAVMAPQVALETVMPDGTPLPDAPGLGREKIRAWLTSLLQGWDIVEHRAHGMILGDDGRNLVMTGEVTLRNRATGRQDTARLIDILEIDPQTHQITKLIELADTCRFVEGAARVPEAGDARTGASVAGY
jgi:hypothetical protein